MKSKHVAFLVIAACAAGVLLLPQACKAASADIAWTAPVKNCNGTPLTDLSGYSMTYGRNQVTLPATANAHTVTGLAPGSWWFSLAALTAAGERSEFITVSRTVTPDEFTTVVAQTAFMAVRQNDAYVMLPVGSVPGGTKCDSNNGVIAGGKSYFAVPSSAVQWYGSTKPTVALATCF